MRRFLKGLPLREWIAADADVEEDEEAEVNDDTTLAGNDESDDEEESEEKDPLLLESGRILADFISLTETRLSQVDNLPNRR